MGPTIITDSKVGMHPVSGIRKKSKEHVAYVYCDIRDYTKYNTKEFTDLLRSKLHLSTYLHVHDPNVLWDLIIKATHEILEIMCPMRRYRQLEILTPWMVADIYREIRVREISSYF